ncbi:MAG TPA: helix-turn-helix transcriptional regulator [Candidatus Acidoferrales bacterium]
MRKRKNNIQVIASSGNVFADLGLPNPEDKKTKVGLAVEINSILGEMKLSQTEAAEKLSINQPKISALSKYRLEGFSVERLMMFLTRLNRDVEIVIHNKPRSRRPARIVISAQLKEARAAR